MDWFDTLFLHWRAEAGSLRALLPPGVELDLHGGCAWVGVVAFRIEHARPRFVPRLLGWAFDEVNVRTYARVPGGKPGVVFLSLDAANPAAVEAARRVVHLNYYHARVAIRAGAHDVRYHSARRDRRAPAARFEASAACGGDERRAAPGTLEHFLVERYCFYTADPRGRLVRGDIAHEPWPLRDATASIGANTLLAALGIAPLDARPLVHVSPGVHARLWTPRTARWRTQRDGAAGG
jgi:uncharacterized protein YqjF (DUF2071 family)